MPGYVFISNSTKPSAAEQKSREEVRLSNVNRPCLEAALRRGYDVFFGTNRENPEGLKCELEVNLYDSHTYRSIFALRDNYIAYKNLCSIIKNNDIHVIHCNTPVGGMIGRIVGKKYNIHRVIYTVHGFHYYKGAPIINNTVFKLAEQLMAHWTDAIITMNQEDFNAARQLRLKKNGKVFKVHGVGINVSEYSDVTIDNNLKRKEIGLKQEDIMLISVGDIIGRKNYKTAIKAIAQLKDTRFHYCICGEGPNRKRMEELALKLGIEKQIHFLGFRKDIKELLTIADIFLLTSTQEGLPRSLMEAMACGLPCVASRIRGNVDLIEDGVNGFLCDIDDAGQYKNRILEIIGDEKLKERFKSANQLRIKQYDLKMVEREIDDIYEELL